MAVSRELWEVLFVWSLPLRVVLNHRRQHRPVNEILRDDILPSRCLLPTLKRSNECLLAFDDDEKACLPLPLCNIGHWSQSVYSVILICS